MREDPDSELLMAKVTCSQLPLPARPRYGLVVVAKEDFKQVGGHHNVGENVAAGAGTDNAQWQWACLPKNGSGLGS